VLLPFFFFRFPFGRFPLFFNFARIPVLCFPVFDCTLSLVSFIPHLPFSLLSLAATKCEWDVPQESLMRTVRCGKISSPRALSLSHLFGLSPFSVLVHRRSPFSNINCVHCLSTFFFGWGSVLAVSLVVAREACELRWRV
jgi:hypothetical protein